MAEISIIEIRQGPVGPAGPAANVTQANIEAAITDKPGFREEIGTVATDGTGSEAAAFRDAIGAAPANLHLSQAEPIATRAGLWDDFNRANTAWGVIGPAPTGQTYGIRYAGSFVNSFRIQNGALESTQGSTWYLGGPLLSEPVFNMGAHVKWSPPAVPNASGYTQMVFLIIPDSDWLDSLIHVRISRISCHIEIATSGGAGGLVERAATNNAAGGYSPAPYYRAADGTTAAYEVIIKGNRIMLLCDGTTILEYEGADVGAVNGNYVFWEHFSGGQFDEMKVTRWWANERRADGNVIGQRVQGYSGTLAKLATGQADFYSGGQIATGDFNVRLGTLIADFFKSRINRALGSSATLYLTAGGTQQAYHPATNCAAGSASASGGTAIGTMTTGQSFNVAPFVVGKVGDRLRVTATGRFAANGNTKELMYTWIGAVQFWSGALTNNGGTWKMVVEIWKSTANNWNFDFQLITSAGVVTKRVTAATGNNLTLVHAVLIGGVASGDTTCDAVFVEALPV